MSYELVFHELALKEWKKLDKTVQQAFKKKLQERLQHPRVESAKLSSMPDCYKIKLVSLGYRLVYRVQDQTVQVRVISIGKRESLVAYKTAEGRL
jgi:mRNA interferase RelE/StbE